MYFWRRNLRKTYRTLRIVMQFFFTYTPKTVYSLIRRHNLPINYDFSYTYAYKIAYLFPRWRNSSNFRHSEPTTRPSILLVNLFDNRINRYSNSKPEHSIEPSRIENQLRNQSVAQRCKIAKSLITVFRTQFPTVAVLYRFGVLFRKYIRLVIITVPYSLSLPAPNSLV